MRRQGHDQPSIAFTITLNDVVIGYTNINRYGPDDNVSIRGGPWVAPGARINPADGRRAQPRGPQRRFFR